MIRSNFSELRRVRHEMSREAGNDLRRYAAMLGEVRERVGSRLVNPGGFEGSRLIKRNKQGFGERLDRSDVVRPACNVMNDAWFEGAPTARL